MFIYVFEQSVLIAILQKVDGGYVDTLTGDKFSSAREAELAYAPNTK